MIRISITAAAFEAISACAKSGSQEVHDPCIARFEPFRIRLCVFARSRRSAMLCLEKGVR